MKSARFDEIDEKVKQFDSLPDQAFLSVMSAHGVTASPAGLLADAAKRLRDHAAASRTVQGVNCKCDVVANELDTLARSLSSLEESREDTADVWLELERVSGLLVKHFGESSYPTVSAHLESALSSLEESRRDAERLDWLQRTREPVYGGQCGEDHIADAWGVYGECDDVRVAIDAAMQSAIPQEPGRAPTR